MKRKEEEEEEIRNQIKMLAWGELFKNLVDNMYEREKEKEKER